MNQTRLTLETQIAACQRSLNTVNNRLVDLCRNRGSQYAKLSADYIDENFIVIDGWRVDEDVVYDKGIDVPGETVAYIDCATGRVVYVNPDARWDKDCQALISENVSEIKSKLEPESEECYIATNIEWDVDDDEWNELPLNVIIPSGIPEDEIVDYLSDRFEFLIKGIDIIPAATSKYGR